MHENSDLDPVFESDRDAGSTAPESGAQSSNVVGRPLDHGEHSVGFHEATETPGLDREAFSSAEALKEGGSYDGLGLPVADDSSGIGERPE
jgi:hypothetical protein